MTDRTIKEKKEMTDLQFLQNEINYIRSRIKGTQDAIDEMRYDMKRLIKIKKKLGGKEVRDDE